ncbi:aldehyde dehydrogenase family protein [Pseudomonas sp. UBA6276]|uniref:aldehyde dehydrogenase family protein n=1 Tax=Pseudomonas sp. UBA6276 TaxID=1947324 RepID=UPI00257DE007|nr:aldehyde dehydrogenase family protein [Pseudomonas sp. UBA6276]
MQLKDTSLFRQQAYIDGAWLGADSGQAIKVSNPATNEILGTVPKMGAAETRRAIEAADKALPAWRALTAKERSNKLRRWFELMIENQDDLARLMTLEQGKPLAEAKGEITYAASFIEWFAEEAKRVYGDTIPGHQPDKRLIVIKQPIGVTAAITPWNFPAAMITRKAGPALAAGCTMVLKPASQTPFSALALAELAERAGIPKGVFSVVTGSAGDIGSELTSNPIVRKLSFTGSTEIGRQLMAECAKDIKKVSLELGGKNSLIVLDDADMDLAIANTAWGVYLHQGQICMATGRVLVQRSIHARFLEKLVAKARSLKVGNPADGEVAIGPLINAQQRDHAARIVAEAQAAGATLATGGGYKDLFFEPTVLSDVSRDNPAFHEEIFAPVAVVVPFDTDDEAVELANDSEYGLSMAIVSSNVGRALKLGERLRTGLLHINDQTVNDEVINPFGGVGASGNGTSIGGPSNIDEFTQWQWMTVKGEAPAYPI